MLAILISTFLISTLASTTIEQQLFNKVISNYPSIKQSNPLLQRRLAGDHVVDLIIVGLIAFLDPIYNTTAIEYVLTFHFFDLIIFFIVAFLIVFFFVSSLDTT